MKFTAVFKYLLLGSLTLLPRGAGETRDGKSSSLHAQEIVQTQIPNVDEKIDAKAQDLVDAYISNVLAGQNRIKHSKKGHSRAVREEFPGAVVRWYCIYGQYSQWNRAVAEMGDTLNLIPFDARHSCPEYRRLMKQKYSGPEYAGVLYNGKMFKSDKDYNNALAAFLKRNRVDKNTPDSVRESVIKKFAQNNFSIESLHPGAMVIIQKSNTPSNTHAVMYLGCGRMENGEFIPDTNGKHLYAGYNNESIEDVFAAYRTDHIFAVDMYNLSRVAYAQEYQKVQNMNYDDMFRYVYNEPYDGLYVLEPNKTSLRAMATEKYFDKNKQNFQPTVTPVHMMTASVIPGPKYNPRINYVRKIIDKGNGR